MSTNNRALEHLREGVNLAVYSGGSEHIFSDRGIKALLGLVRGDSNILLGAEVADTVVGKAAAMLMVKGKVNLVWANVLSKAAAETFDKYGIAYEYGTLVDAIINRAGTGLCPMEQAVIDIDEPESAIFALLKKVQELSAK